MKDQDRLVPLVIADRLEDEQRDVYSPLDDLCFLTLTIRQALWQSTGAMGGYWLWSVLPHTTLLWNGGGLLLSLLPWFGCFSISSRFWRNPPVLQQIGDEDIYYARQVRRRAAPFPALLDGLLVAAYSGVFALCYSYMQSPLASLLLLVTESAIVGAWYALALIARKRCGMRSPLFALTMPVLFLLVGSIVSIDWWVR